MDVSPILGELRREKGQREEAILSLERLIAGQGERRGCPPKWLQAVKEGSTLAGLKKRRGRPPGSGNGFR